MQNVTSHECSVSETIKAALFTLMTHLQVRITFKDKNKGEVAPGLSTMSKYEPLIFQLPAFITSALGGGE
jgi:hypothetical protein